MARRPTFVLAALILGGTFLATPSAQAQIIIQPRNPVLDQEEVYRRQVREWVVAYLGRKPNEKELLVLVQRLKTGTSPTAVQAFILASDEFYKKHGGTTQGFIQGLFVDVLGRKATPQEMLQLVAKANGAGRQRFALEFLTVAQGPVNPLMPNPLITNPVLTNPVFPPVQVVPVPVPVPVPINR